MGELVERGRQAVRKHGETNGDEEERDECFKNWSVHNSVSCFNPRNTHTQWLFIPRHYQCGQVNQNEWVNYSELCACM